MASDDVPTPASGGAPSAESPPWWRTVLLFPLTRLVLALFFLWAAVIARDVLLPVPRDAEVLRPATTLLSVYLGYVGYVLLVERRRVRELHDRRAPAELALGLGIGAGMIALVVGTLWLLGAYRVEGVGSWSVLLVPLVATASTAVWEEIVFRGVLFRMIEEGLGTWIALVVSAAAFGAVHLGNENVSILAVATIAGVAGVFLAGVYILTRRLWLAIGAHYAVNLTQGPIFDLPVSGRERSGLLHSTLEGPELLTGGAFGIEGSLLTAAIGATAAVYVVWRAHDQGMFVRPLWRSEDRGVGTGSVLPELR